MKSPCSQEDRCPNCRGRLFPVTCCQKAFLQKGIAEGRRLEKERGILIHNVSDTTIKLFKTEVISEDEDRFIEIACLPSGCGERIKEDDISIWTDNKEGIAEGRRLCLEEVRKIIDKKKRWKNTRWYNYICLIELKAELSKLDNHSSLKQENVFEPCAKNSRKGKVGRK